jgi:PAS domain S-box-containing protein
MATRERANLASAAGPDRLRASVRILLLAVYFLLASSLAIALLLNRQETLNEGQRRAENLALILGDHLVRTVNAIDITLGQLALHHERAAASGNSREVWGQVFAATRSATAGVAALSILDEDGIVIFSTVPALIGQSRADTNIFRRLSTEADPGLAADPPVRGQASGQFAIPFARKLQGADGRFAGALVATLEPERLRGFYRTIDVGKKGYIWVMHPLWGVLFREPRPADLTEAATLNNPLVARLKDTAPSGFVRAPFEPGGAEYFSAYRRNQAPPMMIAVSLEKNEILAAWWKSAVISAGIVAGFGVLLLFAWRMFAREIRARNDADRRNVEQAKELAAAISKREEADAALRVKEAQFQSIMDHAPMMVSLKGLDGRFTFVNQAYVAFAERSEESILGHTIGELQTREHAALMEAHDRAVIESRHAMQWEVTIPKRSGPRTVLVVTFPVYDNSGSIASVGAILADITDQKRAESHLAQSQRMEALGQLTGGIAHDFNNLLTAILLNADVLASVLDDRLRPLAEAVRMAGERGADLTRRLLAFGRRQILEPRPTEVRALLTGMEPLMHRTLGAHIEVESRHAPDLWFATVDPSQLENAVLNLAVNARDAMPEGGRLTIETANVEFDDKRADAFPESKAGQYVMIAVGDTGCGMPPEVVARAFEPFFTTKDVGKGTGLGLSMVYGFVNQSGGHARIHSEVGVGTVVRLYLPRSMTAPEMAEAGPASQAELPTGKETILFVEDDPMVRQHTGKQIVGLGYAILMAENATEALALIDDGYVPDLLFTDVVMPGGVNGRQLALKLRERWPGLRVLYTSGYAHGQLTIDGESVPSKYVLGKPYRRADLAAKLREVLDEPAG